MTKTSEQIKEALEKVTAGKWFSEPYGHGQGRRLFTSDKKTIFSDVDSAVGMLGTEGDAEAIAALHNLVPKLLAELELREKEVDIYQSMAIKTAGETLKLQNTPQHEAFSKIFVELNSKLDALDTQLKAI